MSDGLKCSYCGKTFEATITGGAEWASHSQNCSAKSATSAYRGAAQRGANRVRYKFVCCGTYWYSSGGHRSDCEKCGCSVIGHPAD